MKLRLWQRESNAASEADIRRVLRCGASGETQRFWNWSGLCHRSLLPQEGLFTESDISLYDANNHYQVQKKSYERPPRAGHVLVLRESPLVATMLDYNGMKQ